MLAIHCSCHHKAEEESGSGTCRRNRFRNNKIGVNTVKFLKMTLAILAIYSLIFLDTAFAKRDSVTGKYFSKQVDKLKRQNIVEMLSGENWRPILPPISFSQDAGVGQSPKRRVQVQGVNHPKKTETSLSP